MAGQPWGAFTRGQSAARFLKTAGRILERIFLDLLQIKEKAKAKAKANTDQKRGASKRARHSQPCKQ
jgi:hypothetical protein